jgi:hypothetical protein
MEERIEARVPPQDVWQAWERAHALHSEKGIQEGQKGKNKFRYKVLDVKHGESFSILWKTLFVRLIFSHSVKPIQRGSLISYRVQIKGIFAWPVRWLLGEKIRKNISHVLRAIVQELEHKRVK